jgi:hypothetical protein
MSTNAVTLHAPTQVDNWDSAGDELSPVRGNSLKFDGGAFFIGREKTLLKETKQFIVVDRGEGWLFLKKGCAAEYIMRAPGAPRPAQPNVPEREWPTDLSGKPSHPWKWTLYIYLMTVESGETFTFSSSTTGGRIGVDELTQQIQIMRRMKPGAVPIIELESKQMKTGYGSKPRPHFAIKGWRTLGDERQKLLTVDHE